MAEWGRPDVDPDLRLEVQEPPWVGFVRAQVQVGLGHRVSPRHPEPWAWLPILPVFRMPDNCIYRA